MYVIIGIHTQTVISTPAECGFSISDTVGTSIYPVYALIHIAGYYTAVLDIPICSCNKTVSGIYGANTTGASCISTGINLSCCVIHDIFQICH